MYQYRLTPSARQDLTEIREYIRDELKAPESARSLMEDFSQAFEKSCSYPLSLPPAEKPLLKARGYRKIIVKNYIAFVLIDQENQFVDIMRVFYYARNYHTIL